MSVIDRIIAEAAARGEFDDLPGKGKPLVLDDDRHIPPDERMSYRIMKNAGVAPTEVTMHQQLEVLRERRRECTDAEERRALAVEIASRIAILNLRMERLRR